MNLDGRIIDKKIFDSFEIEEAEKYLGKEGYFANSNEMFSNLDNCIFGKLEEINDDIKPYSDSYLNYRYFLPKEFVSNEINQERKMFEPRLKDILKFCKDDIIIEANKNNRIFIFEYFSNCYDYKPITEVLKTLSFKKYSEFENFFDLKEFLDYKIEEITVDSYYGITKIILKKCCD